MWRDIERRAEGYGFFAKTPVPYPLSEFDLANQIAILGFKEGWGEKFVVLTHPLVPPVWRPARGHFA